MSDTTKLWQLYQRGVEHHTAANMYKDTERYHNFYLGDQWHGVRVGEEELPIYNIIKPIVKYKVGMIAQNLMSIIYRPMEDPRMASLCELLTKFAATQWEKCRMDTLSWSVIRGGAIEGDHYLYFQETQGAEAVADSVAGQNRPHSPRLWAKLLHNTDIYLADEQNPDLASQQWIILAERLPVEQLRETARRNGIPEEQIELIVADHETETQLGQTQSGEVRTEHGKAISLLYMELGDKGVKFCRATRSVEYQPEQLLPIDCYPVVGFRWEQRAGSARGVSEVGQLLPNQLIINKTAARRAIAVKRFAFPTTVYDPDKLRNAGLLGVFGASIPIENLGGTDIGNYVRYLNPAPIANDAQVLQMELINETQKLGGAGDAATGQVDPTKASGEAIKAARDQAAVPLNEQIASYRQFVEDVALLWYKLWVAYSVSGLRVEDTVIPQEELRGLEVGIKVEVSPVDPYSRISQEISLDRLFRSPIIEDTERLQEFANTLDDSATIPRSKLQAIIDRRLQKQQEGGEPNAMQPVRAGDVHPPMRPQGAGGQLP